MGQINKRWFVDRLRDAGRSQADLARHLKRDPSAVSLILSGKRRFQIDEARAVADFLRVPIEDVLRNAGIPLAEVGGERHCPLVGHINGHRVFVKADVGNTVPAPAGQDNVVAVQARTAGSAVASIDGWTLYFNPDDRQAPELAMQRMVLARLTDGRELLGVLSRGYKPGTFNLTLAGDILDNLEITDACPIVWIKP